MSKSIDPIAWGLTSDPNFGFINFNNQEHVKDFVSNEYEMNRIHSQIRDAHIMKRKSLTCMVGSEGIGKTTLVNALNYLHTEYKIIDFKPAVDLYKNHHHVSLLILETCNIFSVLFKSIEGFDLSGYLLPSIKNKSKIKNLEDETQFIGYLIEEFSLVCREKSSTRQQDFVVLLDNLDLLNEFQFRFILNLFGALAANLPTWNFCIMVSPQIRLAMSQSEYLGESTDVVVVDGTKNFHYSTNSILRRRFQNHTIPKYGGPLMIDRKAYRLLEQIDNKKNALDYMKRLYEYAMNNCSITSPTLQYSVVLNILTNPFSILSMNNNLNTICAEFDFRSLEQELMAADLNAVEVIGFLRNSESFCKIVENNELLEEQLFAAKLDFK